MRKRIYFSILGLTLISIILFWLFYGVLETLFLAFITVAMVILLLVHFVAKYLTRKIVKLLNNITTESTIDIYNDSFYEELLPYIKRMDDNKRAIEEQNKAEAQRREFSANVSHELKTPLTTISALSEMMANGMARPEDFADFAAKITTQSNRLINIIEDIIRLSEFDENKADREYIPFDIYELANAVIAALHEKASAKNIAVELRGLPLQMTANHSLIDELLYNLIDNAIKYNKDGGQIVVDLQAENNQIKIAVTDTGIGIPPAHHDRIFERFYRVDNSRSKKTGGTGLGLSIVKHIVGHHNGEIELISEADTGTSIVCKFPA
ncbi:MAG: ATP-binding protein [Defluviitaleaceae bacterium]|nr:ATP-binding protein [Defluviitaleaceae bacterium]